jgi:hypothetical protein
MIGCDRQQVDIQFYVLPAGVQETWHSSGVSQLAARIMDGCDRQQVDKRITVLPAGFAGHM